MGCFAYFSGIAFGQTSTNKNKNKPPQTTFSRKTIEGKEYYFYRIEENDVLDSIGLKFDVTPDVIRQYNPEIKQAPLTEGHLLIIPVRYNTAQIANAQKHSTISSQAEKRCIRSPACMVYR